MISILTWFPFSLKPCIKLSRGVTLHNTRTVAPPYVRFLVENSPVVKTLFLADFRAKYIKVSLIMLTIDAGGTNLSFQTMYQVCTFMSTLWTPRCGLLKLLKIHMVDRIRVREIRRMKQPVS